MKPCKKYEERVSEMLFGEIPDNEKHVLHLHMASCDGCMEFYLSLYETLETGENEDFYLSEEQKSEIFEEAQRLDKPIKKLSSLWTTGVSIAASLLVSGLFIFLDSDFYTRHDFAKGEKAQDAAEASELKVAMEEVKELRIELPVEQPMPQKSKEPDLANPVLSTVIIGNNETNDIAFEDTEDDIPSTDDNLVDRAVSDIVVSPSAFATQLESDTRLRGSKKQYKITNNSEKEEEGLDLVDGVGSVITFNAYDASGGVGGLDAGDDGLVGGISDAGGGEDYKGKLKFNDSKPQAPPVDEAAISEDDPFADPFEEELDNSSAPKVAKPENKKVIFDDLDKDDLKSDQQLAQSSNGISPVEKAEKLYESRSKDRKYLKRKNEVEKTLSEEPYNEDAINELTFLNKKIYESGRQRREAQHKGYLSEVEWNWSDPVNVNEDTSITFTLQSELEFDKKEEKELFFSQELGQVELDYAYAKHKFKNDELKDSEDTSRLQNEIGLSLGNFTVQNNPQTVEQQKSAEKNNVESAVKQQRELEADNLAHEAVRYRQEGNLKGAKEAVEKALAKYSKLDQEKRILGKKEKLQDLYETLTEDKEAKRPMLSTQAQPMSTFSIDVDTASYQMAKQQIKSGGRPDPLSVRAEEFINYFNYNYEAPKSKAFMVHNEVAVSPFHRGSKIMKIGVQGKRPGGDHRAASHFCFIVDTSGSMADGDRLPMVKKVLPMIIKQMAPGDKVSLVSCGLNSRLELDYVDVQNIDYVIQRINGLNAVGATNLEASLIDGYKHILKHVRKGTYNRVVLFSDGVANLGEKNAENILNTLSFAKNKGVGITVVGMGEEEYNDNFLETLADKGDGNYVYIGDSKEAQKTFEEKFAATFHTIAYNVKIQVEFDPNQVSKYRLLGYENRRLKNKDFRNDKVDAGEVGSGQSVTAIYEIEMTGRPSSKPIADVRLRYRDAVDNEMKEFSTPVLQSSYNTAFENASEATRLAFISGKFAEVLRDGGNSEGITVDDLLKYLRPLSSQMYDSDVRELMYVIEKSR